MPVVPVDYEDLVRLMGRRIDRDELVARVPMMGGAFDGERDGQLLFEFFPNRPDLLSPEGLARACRAFFDLEPGLKTYPLEPSGEEVIVDPTVTRVRPFIGFARVAGVRMDEALLTNLIELQERLTTGPGRRRKKVAIGIHDAAPVKGPYTYKGVLPDEVRFVPLQATEEMTPRQILERHEKGRLFRHLVEGHARYPLIVDGTGQVLSLPPIINGQLTALTTRTRDVLLDVTGTDERTTLGILNIVATSLAERGGQIQTMRLVRPKGTATTPDLTPQERTLPFARVTTLLGLKPSLEEARTFLGRMGHAVEGEGGRSARVRSPAWRLDLQHVDDLVEDVGIGYGFERFAPRLPTVARFGGLVASSRQARRARTLLLGLGFSEVVTLTITSKRDVFEAFGATAAGVVEVANPVTLEHAILRPQLVPSLMGILRANKHRELPQTVFEVGQVVPPGPAGASPRNQWRAAAVRLAPRATFAECKGVVEAFLRDAGRSARIEPGAVPGFVPGRCGKLVHEGSDVGFFGEVHPDTIQAFELGAPAYALEVVL